jgi:hypothetical protein
MISEKKVTGGALLALGLALLLSGCGNNAPEAHHGHQGGVKLELPSPQSGAPVMAQNVPHYFENPEAAKPFPTTLDPAQFSEPAVKRAYQIAQRIPDVLAQQPCYCFCDKGFNHGSLLHCHIDDHSAG